MEIEHNKDITCQVKSLPYFETITFGLIHESYICATEEGLEKVREGIGKALSIRTETTDTFYNDFITTVDSDGVLFYWDKGEWHPTSEYKLNLLKDK
jgi:hypothetical protein